MATDKLVNNSDNFIGISGYWASIGRADGNLSIVVHVRGKFSAFSLSQTSGISVDVYGNKGYGNVTCSFDSVNSNIQPDGTIYLRFTPSSSTSGYVDAGRPCTLNISTKITMTLTR